MDCRIAAVIGLLVLAGCGQEAPPVDEAFDEVPPFVDEADDALDGITVDEASLGAGSASVVVHGLQDDIVVAVEVADSEEERARGYSGRDAPAPDTGMLFVFDEVSPVSFHMKDVSFLLDILFLDEKGVVVNLATMTPCRSTPCPVWQSRESVKYAVELPVGFIKEHRVSRGTKVSISLH